MWIRTLPTTLLQIICKKNPDYEVIVKTNMDPDDNLSRYSLSING